MTNTNGLREIRAHLDNVPTTDENSAGELHCYTLVEERAISILDSQHENFDLNLLQQYLMGYLHLRRMEYGLIDLPDSGES